MKGFFLVLNNHRRKIRSAGTVLEAEGSGRTCGQKQNKVTGDRGSRLWVAGTPRRGSQGLHRPRSGTQRGPVAQTQHCFWQLLWCPLTPPPGCWRCLSPGLPLLPCGRMGRPQYSVAATCCSPGHPCPALLGSKAPANRSSPPLGRGALGPTWSS